MEYPPGLDEKTASLSVHAPTQTWPFMHPVDYLNRIKSGKYPQNERALMARIALNTLLDPHVYAVDLSELSELEPEPYLLSRSLLAYCRIFPQYFGSLKPRELAFLQGAMAGFKKESYRDPVSEGVEAAEVLP